MSTITDSFRAARQAANLTQKDIALALGVTPQWVNDIEHGRREMPEKHYDQLPEPVRSAVIDAAIKSLMAKQFALHQMLFCKKAM